MPSVTTTINTTRTFGVEIEFCHSSAARIAAWLNRNGVACTVEGYNHNVRESWKIVTDGSVRGYGANGNRVRGLELVSPVLSGQAGLEQVATVLRCLRVHHAIINQSTGLHVHVGVADLDLDRFKGLLKQVIRDEVLFDLFISAERQTNMYCRSLLKRFGQLDSKDTHDATVRNAFNVIDNAQSQQYVYYGLQDGRYYKFNLAAYARQGTIEYRLKEGCIEHDEVISWVKMVVELTQWYSRHPKVQVAANTYGPIKKIAKRMLAKISTDAATYLTNKYLGGTTN